MSLAMSLVIDQVSTCGCNEVCRILELEIFLILVPLSERTHLRSPFPFFCLVFLQHYQMSFCDDLFVEKLRRSIKMHSGVQSH